MMSKDRLARHAADIDAVLAGDIKSTIKQLARLMTEAKKRNIVVNFNILEVPSEPPEFQAAVLTIQKIETL